MLIRPEFQIAITPLPGGAAVRFAKDETLNSSLKAKFPKARWGRGTKSWHIPGKLAVQRVNLWAADQQAYLAGLERAARDAEWDGRPTTPAEAGRRALAAMPPFKSIRCALTDDGGAILLHCAYHPGIVALCRALGGRWRGNHWALPAAAGVEIAARREDIRAMHNETVESRKSKFMERDQ